MTYGNKISGNILKEKRMAPTRPVDMCLTHEDDYLETDIHSPTDSSEDSVEVKVSPIASLRNKRKCLEPRKVPETFTGPLKKRMCLKVKAERAESHPFRPWSPTQASPRIKEETPIPTIIPSDIHSVSSTAYPLPCFVVPPVPVLYHPITNHRENYAYFRPPTPPKLLVEDKPVSLVKRETKDDLPATVPVTIKREICEPPSSPDVSSDSMVMIKREPCESPRVPIHPQVQTMTPMETDRLILDGTRSFPGLQLQSRNEQLDSACASKREQRNYKNMTRERRIEANARERTRVHTISAAFDTLRRSIPAYSHNQKLSKLSVLRIACAYIDTLSTIVRGDEDGGRVSPVLSEHVENVTKTIQKEGKLRKKKDDND